MAKCFYCRDRPGGCSYCHACPQCGGDQRELVKAVLAALSSKSREGHLTVVEED